MDVKTSTKEKFHAISVASEQLTANMAASLQQLLLPFLDQEVRNVVLNLEAVAALEEPAAETLVKLQQHFYEQNASFVVCCLQPGVETFLDKTDLLELMNVTPSESEAWDIVQMEEIERELLGDEENF